MIFENFGINCLKITTNFERNREMNREMNLEIKVKCHCFDYRLNDWYLASIAHRIHTLIIFLNFRNVEIIEKPQEEEKLEDTNSKVDL